MAKRKRRRGGNVPRSLRDLPQAPRDVETHAELLRRFDVPDDMVEQVAYAQVTYLAIALVQAAGGRVELPADWRDKAGMTVEQGGGYVVSVSTVGETLPDPRRN